MTTRELSSQLTALSESVRTTLHLISRLSKLNFQPGSTPLESGDRNNDVCVELTQDIHEGLKQHEETLELFKSELEDLTASSGRHSRRDDDKEKERTRLVLQASRLSEDLKHARSQFRRAQLNAKRSSEAAKQQEREALFATLRNTPLNEPSSKSTDLFAGRRQTTKQLNQDDLLINASHDVTSALRQTHDRLASEVTRSRFASETLEASELALRELGDRYTDLDTLLSNSKSLLSTLVTSQKSDTWYLETAFYLLCITLSWLVFRRLIYGPAWWFIWVPLKYFLWKPFAFALSVVGIGGGAASTAVSSSVRPSLIIQPSASGGIPKFPKGMDRNAHPGIPVGGGGAGAKVPPRPEQMPNQGRVSDQIGQMAEDSRREAQGAGEQKEPPIKRADGTVLEPRGDKPKNPKKKMFEADVEDRKEEMRKRDEL